MEKLTIRLPSSTLASLRQRARKNGGNVSQEIRRAAHAYLLGVPPGEHEMLKALSDEFEEFVKKYARTLNPALHKIERRKKAPSYPADDGPLTANQIKQIRRQAKPPKGKVLSSRSLNLSGLAARSKRSGSDG